MEHGEGESAAKELETRLVALIEATVAARLVPFERMSTLVDAHVQMAENSRREAGQMADDAKKLVTRSETAENSCRDAENSRCDSETAENSRKDAENSRSDSETAKN